MEMQRGNAGSGRSLPPQLAGLRRRHEDVDIVVLPPDGPPSGGPVADEQVQAAAAKVDGLASQVWTDATDVRVEPVTRVGYGPEPGTVVAKSRILVRVPGGEHVVHELARVLGDDGWRVGRAPDGPRLVARRDDVFARVSYADVSGAVLVDLACDPMLVGTDRARRLVRS
jgi:hypothetical protein